MADNELGDQYDAIMARLNDVGYVSLTTPDLMWTTTICWLHTGDFLIVGKRGDPVMYDNLRNLLDVIGYGVKGEWGIG